MDCKAIQQQIFGYIYGETTADELRKIKAHLDRCGHCEEEAQIIEDLLAKLKDGLEEEPLPDGFRDRVLSRIHTLAEDS